MTDKPERMFEVRGRSIGAARFRGVIASNGAETRSLRWTSDEATRIIPESVYRECKADKGLVIVKLREVSAEEASAQPVEAEAPAPGPVDLSTLTNEALFAELERREASAQPGADDDQV